MSMRKLRRWSATDGSSSGEALSWRAVAETAEGPHLRTIRCNKLAEMVKLGKAKLPASWSEVEGDGKRAQARRDNSGAVAPLRRFRRVEEVKEDDEE